MSSTEDKSKPVRLHLPEHLKREVTEIYPEGDLFGMVYMGKQVTKQLEVRSCTLNLGTGLKPPPMKEWC